MTEVMRIQHEAIMKHCKGNAELASKISGELCVEKMGGYFGEEIKETSLMQELSRIIDSAASWQ